MNDWYNTVQEALKALSPRDRRRYVGTMCSGGRCQAILAKPHQPTYDDGYDEQDCRPGNAGLNPGS